MRLDKWSSPAGFGSQSSHCGWHRLEMDTQGCITCGDSSIACLLDMHVDTLVGKPVASVIPDIPFSVKTPGYNLAYAIFNATNGDRTRRRAVAANGRAIPLDTMWTVRKVGEQRHITLNFRSIQD